MESATATTPSQCPLSTSTGGSALGAPVTFGGVAGSLPSGVSFTDTSFLNLFIQQFAPGLQLSFVLGVTSNDDLGGIPDGFDILLLDSSGVPLPTLAPVGDLFVSSSLGSSGLMFTAYGSDPTRTLSVGDAVNVPPPSLTPAESPEPAASCLIGAALVALGLLKKVRRPPNPPPVIP